jgi:hypothetical protein
MTKNVIIWIEKRNILRWIRHRKDEKNALLLSYWKMLFISEVEEKPNNTVKADSHIACRAHAVPLPCRAVNSHIACRAHAVPLPCRAVNSHMPCRAPALLRPCCVLREGSHGSRKYPNCQSRSLTDRLFCSVLLLLYSLSMINAIWFHSGHLHLRLVCYW